MVPRSNLCVAAIELTAVGLILAAAVAPAGSRPLLATLAFGAAFVGRIVLMAAHHRRSSAEERAAAVTR